jgi:hypothetical protein
MKRTILAVAAVSAVAGAIVIPSIALGNARRTSGTLSGLQEAETPYVAQLKGSTEVPVAGDPDGSGAASVSIDFFDAVDAEVCWDVTFSGIGTPTLAHIHRGAAGSPGPVVVDFGVAAGFQSRCVDVTAALATEMIGNPANFYVNIHTAEFAGGALRGQLAKGAEPAGSAHFLPTPLRAYDSRIAPATKPGAAETRTISLATGKNGTVDEIAVPPGATAAIVTITATDTSGPSFLSAYSAALTAAPSTSSLNWTTAGATVAVSTQVAVDATGSIKITTGPAGTHVLVDVTGFMY